MSARGLALTLTLTPTLVLAATVAFAAPPAPSSATPVSVVSSKSKIPPPKQDSEVEVSDVIPMVFSYKKGRLEPMEPHEYVNAIGDFGVVVRLIGNGVDSKQNLKVEFKRGTKLLSSQTLPLKVTSNGWPNRLFVLPVGFLCGEITVTATVLNQKVPSSKTIRRSFLCGD